MWAQVNELLFKKYFGTRPVTPLHNLYPSKPIFTRPKDGWTGGWLSAWLLLRNTSYTCTVKKNSFQARVECVRMNPGEQSQGQWKPILHRGPVTENAKIYIAPLQGYYS